MFFGRLRQLTLMVIFVMIIQNFQGHVLLKTFEIAKRSQIGYVTYVVWMVGIAECFVGIDSESYLRLTVA